MARWTEDRVLDVVEQVSEYLENGDPDLDKAAAYLRCAALELQTGDDFGSRKILEDAINYYKELPN